MEKNRKFPNRTDKIEIPASANISIDARGFRLNGNYYTPAEVKKFTFTASSVPSNWLDEYFKPSAPLSPETINSITNFPGFYTPQERARAEIANLRFKAKQLLGQPFSAGKAYNEFGTSKLPMESVISCKICNNTMQYVVDFFIHTVLDHGNSPQRAESAFQGVLDKLESLL